MDKYLIKTPKDLKTESKNFNSESRSKQLTLESLAGVVVIEDILRSKTILEFENQNPDEIISELESLKEKNPSREILISTGIGKTIHKLCRHCNQDVANSAKIIYKKWKSSVIDKATKPMIEVKCDLKTENFRLTARKWLLKSLMEDKEQLAELIEREVFHFHKRLINGTYRKSIRRIVFALKNENFRTKVIGREININTVIATHCKL